MSEKHHTNAPQITCGMLIRRPVHEVFNALVDPAHTSRFWFSSGSGKLAPNARVQWRWNTFKLAVTVEVIVFEPNRRLVVAWPSPKGISKLEWRFTERPDGSTYVSISETGVDLNNQRLQQALGSSEGFTLVLAGLKSYLEHGKVLPLITDRYSAELSQA
jgi:uncharacterized protein YndB with AHSA1/START domain